jgi:hypothetical protein
MTIVRLSRSMSCQRRSQASLDPKTMPNDQQADETVAVTVPVGLEGYEQLIDLGLGLDARELGTRRWICGPSRQLVAFRMFRLVRRA